MEYFDNKQAGLMADMVMSMLKAMAQKFGIEVSLDRSQHTRSKLTLQVSFVVMGADGIPSDFGYKADRVGAPRDLWGKKFMYMGRGRIQTETYTVVDIKPRNRKYPIIATRDCDGASYKFPVKIAVTNLVENS